MTFVLELFTGPFSTLPERKNSMGRSCASLRISDVVNGGDCSCLGTKEVASSPVTIVERWSTEIPEGLLTKVQHPSRR